MGRSVGAPGPVRVLVLSFGAGLPVVVPVGQEQAWATAPPCPSPGGPPQLHPFLSCTVRRPQLTQEGARSTPGRLLFSAQGVSQDAWALTPGFRLTMGHQRLWGGLRVTLSPLPVVQRQKLAGKNKAFALPVSLPLAPSRARPCRLLCCCGSGFGVVWAGICL